MDATYSEAIRKFQRAWSRVKLLRLREPAAMSLATADAQGRPSVRTVLLKGVDAGGFVFYTNSRSRKGRQLAENAQAALVFYWDRLRRQVCVEGRVEEVSEGDADAYWATRSRNSQIGAWASQQSEPLSGRAELLGRVAQFTAQFAGRPVPRPPHWRGYRLVPDRIEFWHAKPFRLHERLVYARRDNRWAKSLVYP